jgi:hypothetical protein
MYIHAGFSLVSSWFCCCPTVRGGVLCLYEIGMNHVIEDGLEIRYTREERSVGMHTTWKFSNRRLILDT